MHHQSRIHLPSSIKMSLDITFHRLTQAVFSYCWCMAAAAAPAAPMLSRLGALVSSPILCFCFLCSVIWSRRSDSCEDRVLTNSCVASSWLCSDLHSFCSPSTSSTAREMARRRGNQSRQRSWNEKNDLLQCEEYGVFHLSYDIAMGL